MSESRILTVDFTQADDILQILPLSPLRSSENLGWQDLHVQQHRQPAWETPEYAHTRHMLLVHSHNVTVGAERWFDGRSQPEEFGGGNNIAIVPANVEHRVNWNRESPFSLIFLTPERLIRVAYESVNTDRIELIPQHAMPDPLIDRIGQALILELSEDRLGSRLFVDSLTTALAIHLLRHYSTWQQPLREFSGGLSQRKLQQAIDYIQANLATDLTISAIAAELDLSEYYFSRLFKQSIDLAPYQYVIQQRVERAKQLLKQPERSIADIAIDCGFASQGHLNLHFKRLVGITPRNFRDR
jgi:AraC family transcriptional regulator